MATATINLSETLELFQKYVVPNYARYPVSLVRGEGSYVWDAEGNRYLDFFPGWGCNLLGHCPPPVVEAVQEQVATLIHVPNTWYTRGRASGPRPFRSGASAARRSSATRAPRPTKRPSSSPACTRRRNATRSSPSTAAFTAARLAATTATAQPKYHEGLGPLMAGFVYAPFGDLEAVQKLIDRETAAIMIEPMQGEGGINIPPAEFLAGLARAVRRKRICS